MSIQTDQIHQMYLTVKAIGDVIIEEMGAGSEVKQNLEHQIYLLEEIMKPVEITSDMVKELRKQTGEGMMCCLKALRQARGNMTFAADIMRR